jgi:hypothetical protein
VSTADQLLSAKISAVCRRHCARGVADNLDAAVADLQVAAGGRSDLLAEHAGLALGMAEVGSSIQAASFRAEAEVCIAAGADQELVEHWTAVGRERAEAMERTPFTGSGLTRGRPARLSAHCQALELSSLERHLPADAGTVGACCSSRVKSLQPQSALANGGLASRTAMS